MDLTCCNIYQRKCLLDWNMMQQRFSFLLVNCILLYLLIYFLLRVEARRLQRFALIFFDMRSLVIFSFFLSCRSAPPYRLFLYYRMRFLALCQHSPKHFKLILVHQWPPRSTPGRLSGASLVLLKLFNSHQEKYLIFLRKEFPRISGTFSSQLPGSFGISPQTAS